MIACHEGVEQARALDDLRRAAVQAGAGGDVVRHDRSGLTVDDRLLALQTFAWARARGGDAQLKAWLEDLLGRHAPDSPARRSLEGYAEDALRLAEEHARRVTMRLGFSDEELLGVMRAVASADSSALRIEGPTCTWIVDNERARAAGWVALYDQAVQDDDASMIQSRLDEASMTAAPLRDWGCLGDEPVFADVYEAYAWSRGAAKLPPLKPGDGGCSQGLIQLEQLKLDDRLLAEAGEAYVGFAGWVPVMQTWNLVRLGCIAAPERP